MRQQLQLPLDHTPSFKAGAELVTLRSPRRPRLEGRVFDDERSVPVVFRTSRSLTVSTVFLSAILIHGQRELAAVWTRRQRYHTGSP